MTPGTPKFQTVRPTEEIKKNWIKDKREHQSGIGMLLSLVKHSCPNLADMTRELSKANDFANPAAYKKLLHVIKYLIKTKNIGLKIKCTRDSSEPWKIICYSDSDYAGDLVSRQSISGFILYVLSVPVSWQSKSQKSVSLSSSEAEYIALSEAVKEVMFMVQLSGSMKIATYRVIVRVDNIGAIFMASSITTTCNTRHVDM